MRLYIAILAVSALPAVSALADDKIPAGAFKGHDGKLWKMEGCAAYPVDAQGNALPVATAPVSTPKAEETSKLAQSKPAKTE